MSPTIPFFSFDSLNSETGFLHGTSPRCYFPEPGNVKPFEPVRGLSFGECNGHGLLFLESVGMGPRPVQWLKQVHGDRVVVAQAGESVEGIEGDALITADPDCVIGVLTADCLPVILCDPVTRSAGIVHAGRKGTQASILAKAVSAMVDAFGTDPKSLRVGLGPGIGPCCYEVEERCALPFKQNFKEAATFVRPHQAGKVFLDLWEANRVQALHSGVPDSQIVLSGECTSCRNDRWFSYRKEGGRAGRMLTVVMWRP